jgi:hypothetical protein
MLRQRQGTYIAVWVGHIAAVELREPSGVALKHHFLAPRAHRLHVDHVFGGRGPFVLGDVSMRTLKIAALCTNTHEYV